MKEVEQLWKHVFASGIGDLLVGFDFISYLFIIKECEERSLRLGGTLFVEDEAESCHWSMIKQMAFVDGNACHEHLRTRVTAWLRTLDSASCLADAEQSLYRPNPQYLFRIMDAVDVLCEHSLSLQDAFESVMTWAETQGAFQASAGQIMTPMHLAYLMADLLQPQTHERVLDMSCGTGNLLVAAWQHMQSTQPNDEAWLLSNGRMLFKRDGVEEASTSLLGYDFNSLLMPPCYAHLFLSGVALPISVSCFDTLGSAFHPHMTQQGDIDIVIANPPFGPYRDIDDLGETLRFMQTYDQELLYVELALQMLREGGRASILVPEGVVRTSTNAALALRQRLVEQNQVLAVISLPKGAFLPQSNVKTSLLVFKKGGSTENDVLFYRVESDGFSLDSKCLPVAQNDLWDVRLRVAQALGQPLSFLPFAQELRRFTYCTAVTKLGTLAPDTGASVPPFERVVGFTDTQTDSERAWFVSPDLLRSNGYSLCATTYRADEAVTCSRPYRRSRR